MKIKRRTIGLRVKEATAKQLAALARRDDRPLGGYISLHLERLIATGSTSLTQEEEKS